MRQHIAWRGKDREEGKEEAARSRFPFITSCNTSICQRSNFIRLGGEDQGTMGNDSSADVFYI